MRLTPAQIEAIKNAVARVMNAPHRVWLFGSRTDDSLRGGDIDLLVETDVVISDRVKMTCQLYSALIFALGDRKLDILLKDPNTPPAPIFEIAKRKGVIL